MITHHLTILAALAALARAWLPGAVAPNQHRSVVDARGAGSFDLSAFAVEEVSPRGGSAVNRKRWLLPQNPKLRGVNLGSLFIVEPWMMSKSWADMGCGGTESEFDCVKKLGQDKADEAFKKHWAAWVTEKDLDEMRASGINTVRVPLGYWMLEELVDTKSEYFPRGGAEYLKQMCAWATARGIYIILELHGAPKAQVTHNAFTGQIASAPGFYETAQYDRAVRFLVWLRKLIHSTPGMRNAGTIGLLNEPAHEAPESLRKEYYPKAIKAIRDAEAALNVSRGEAVHIQMMNKLWGTGDPLQFLSEEQKYFTSFDDHRYLKWDPSVDNKNPKGLIAASCKDDRQSDGLSPTVVGEWSLSVPDDVERSDQFKPDTEGPNAEFYKKWFAAQAAAYERSAAGWTFWSWKAELGDDYRWSYKDALAAGIIPKDLNSTAELGKTACA